MPWTLCAGYGLTTPVAIAVGLGLRTTYDAGSFTASVVGGLLDSRSAGILIFTGLVELLARDFLFDAQRTRDGRRLAFMVVCVLLAAAVMALLGKWAYRSFVDGGGSDEMWRNVEARYGASRCEDVHS